MADNEFMIVQKAFEEWMDGTSYVSRIFAPAMTWEIVGRSAASASYRSADEFTTKVMEPFDRRFSASEPFRLVKIRAIYADGPTVTVLWDGAGITVLGTPYENTYAWVLTLSQGLIVDGVAFYDSIAFNELWEIAPQVGRQGLRADPALRHRHGRLCAGRSPERDASLRPLTRRSSVMPDQNRFLKGPFAPVEEEITASDLPVTGSVPTGLSGRYLRNGPNPLGLEDPGYRFWEGHWFLGPGMVHGVRLRDGKAEWYRNRWVRSQLLAEAMGETWPAGPVHADMDFAANTHIIAHAGRLLATVEAGPLPYELSGELETLGPCDFGGTLPGGFAAHTKLDRRTGELHAIAYFWAWDHVQHVVIGTDGQVSRTTDIPVPGGPMMHDFALTASYVVLFDLPVTFSMDAVSAGLKLPYTWNPAHQARVGLLPRDDPSAGVRWFEVEPCWVFHTLNAYDDSGRVVADLVRYENAYDVSTLSGHGPLTLDRWIIDPGAGKVTQQRLDDRPQEFPRVDDRAISQPHRYGYSAVIGAVGRATVSPSGDFADETFSNALLKHDLTAGTVQAHQFGSNATAGEAVFAPAAPDATEDDGYVMAFVHNPARGAADLVILAAQDFTGQPVARVHLPARIPLGFHGSWIPDQ